MTPEHSAIPRLIALLLVGVLAPGCSNPDVEKQQHLERGNAYAAEKKDDFAVIEYASAVRLDPKFGEARLKLAETYERMNNLQAAFPEFVRAADALPDNRDVQIKATEVLLIGGRFDDAKVRASTLLEKNPKDVDALILRANAMAMLKDPEGAVGQIEEALKLQPGESRVFASLGEIRMRSGQMREAEDAFKQSLALEPSSVPAHLAFANFLLSVGRPAEAEQELRQALSLQPRNLMANRMLGVLYMGTKRQAEAEAPLKAVAEISQLPAARFQLAEYYVSVDRNDDATKILNELAADRATADGAEAMLASMDYAKGRAVEAHARLDKVIARAPTHAGALLLRARWLTSENKLDTALEAAKAAVAADPQSSPAQYALGQVYDLRREVPDATKAYEEALRLNPRAVAAQVALSRLNLVAGNRDTALRYAEEAKQTEPGNAAARVALARSLLNRGDLVRADTEIKDLLRGLPNAAVTHVLSGTLQARQKNAAAARTAFARALELTPGNFEAIAGLVGLDLQAKQFGPALARIDAELAKQPNRAELLALAGQAYLQAGQADKAEQSLRRAVTVDPKFSAAYTSLAVLYLQQKRLDEARAEFEAMAKREPGAVGPPTMVGMLLETQGKRDQARQVYEGVVAGSREAPVAANNLAFIYAEEGTNLDVALQLATSAKQLRPDDADVDDTLGWVYYKKDLPALAVGPLEESLSRKPDHPDILYHLGMTYAKLGDKAKARASLERALKLNPQLAGAAIARQTLASLSQ